VVTFRWGEGDDHTGLDDTSLNTTDGHRSNTTDLVDILKGETEGLVGGTGRGLDGIDSVERVLPLTAPALVSLVQPLYHVMLDIVVSKIIILNDER
jgi:hypothetical protein